MRAGCSVRWEQRRCVEFAGAFLRFFAKMPLFVRSGLAGSLPPELFLPDKGNGLDNPQLRADDPGALYFAIMGVRAFVYF